MFYIRYFEQQLSNHFTSDVKFIVTSPCLTTIYGNLEHLSHAPNYHLATCYGANKGNTKNGSSKKATSSTDRSLMCHYELNISITIPVRVILFVWAIMWYHKLTLLMSTRFKVVKQSIAMLCKPLPTQWGSDTLQ